uniref:solute carrier family 22 member 5-like n=1 Tax=Styela clava TaxID=7725 RepID=UPI001939D24A|nr:solute carrier family 22 member 5-like [Styela clava]
MIPKLYRLLHYFVRPSRRQNILHNGVEDYYERTFCSARSISIDKDEVSISDFGSPGRHPKSVGKDGISIDDIFLCVSPDEIDVGLLLALKGPNVAGPSVYKSIIDNDGVFIPDFGSPGRHPNSFGQDVISIDDVINDHMISLVHFIFKGNATSGDRNSFCQVCRTKTVVVGTGGIRLFNRDIETKFNMKLEDYLSQVGSFGFYHKRIYAITSIAAIPNSFFTLHFLFANFQPDFRCDVSDHLSGLFQNITSEHNFAFVNSTTNLEHNFTGVNQCYTSLLATNDGNKTNNNTSPIFVECQNEWIFDLKPYQKSAVTEFGLVCDLSWKAPLVISIFQIGRLLGGFSSAFGDRFGRKPLFVFSCVLQTLGTAIAAISWNYVIYIISALIVGVGMTINDCICFVVATETIGVKKRNFVAVGSFISSAVAYIAVPGLAYFLQDWKKYLWAATGLAVVCYAPCLWFFPESARWLLKKGRMQEAKKELETIAKLNGTKANYQQILKDNVIELDSTIHQMKTTGLIETARILLRSRIRWRIFTCFYGWFVTCMVYYGIILHSTRFSKDRFLNCFIAGIAEVPAYIVAYFAIKYIGRPRTFSLCMFLCGFSCSLLPFMPENSSPTTAVAILAKTGVATAFFAVYTISSEISPTLQRSSLLGIGSGLGRVGSCLAPFLMFMGKFYHSLPNITMGALTIFCGVITFMFIPETKGQPMPDTVEEALNNNRIYGWRICRCHAPKNEDVTTDANKEVHEI